LNALLPDRSPFKKPLKTGLQTACDKTDNPEPRMLTQSLLLIPTMAAEPYFTYLLPRIDPNFTHLLPHFSAEPLS
jgi:hypothetical protein